MRLRLSFIALMWLPAAVQSACSICKGGVGLTKPDGIVTTEEGQSSTCSALTSHIGSLPQEDCENLQHIARKPCGCPSTGHEAEAEAETTQEDPMKSSLMTNGGRDPLESLPVMSQSSPFEAVTEGTPVDPFKASLTTDEARDPLGSMPIVSGLGPFVCSICKNGAMKNPSATTIDSAGIPISCQMLHDTRDSITEDACARVQSFAAAPCGCDMSDPPPSVEAMVGGNSAAPFVCNVCGDGVIGNPNGIVVNDRGVGRSCAELQANRDRIPSHMCADFQNTALEPCECLLGDEIDQGVAVNQAESPNTVLEIEESFSQCSICGDGVMTNPNGIVTNRNGQSSSCLVLDANPKEISAAACANIQVISKEPCGCIFPQQESGAESQSNSVSSECSICGGGSITIPDGIVVTPEGQAGRCSALQANAITIPQDACPEIQQLAKDPCGCTEAGGVVETGGDTASWIGQDFDAPEVCHVCGGAAQKVGNPGTMVTTPTGLFTCYSLFSAGVGGAIPMEECSAVQAVVAESCGCFVEGPTPAPSEQYDCNICGDGLFVTTPDGLMNTNDGMTCGEYLVQAAQGKIGEDKCSMLQEKSVEACGCEPPPMFPTDAPTTYECQICGPGWEIGSPDAEIMLPNYTKMSCATLQQRAESGAIHSSQCARYVPLAQQKCNCREKPYEVPLEAPSTYDCNICGSNLKATNPSGIVALPNQPDRTCIELMTEAAYGKFNEYQCTLLHPYVKQPCGCEDPYSTVSDQASVPAFAPTAPVPTQEPSAKRGDCFQDLGEIQALERAVQDTSVTRMYILCPGTTFDLGVWTDEGAIEDGQPFIAIRPNVIYQCGHDGSRVNDCVLKGGDFGLASYHEVYEGIAEVVPGVEIRGLTFESQNLFSVILKSAGDITFTGCAFKGNSNNVPVLMQWEEKEGLSGLRQVVTFQDCVFRDNFADNSLSFPGIIENTFNSELIVRNSLFENNVYGTNNNLAPMGYAIRSFGSLNLESTCFIDNVFLNNGPVLMYGAQLSADNNYIKSSQKDLTCELGALFSSQDDMIATDPSCEFSDANVCAFTQGPTSAPSLAPKFPLGVPTQDKSPGSSSTTTTAETNQASSTASISGRRPSNVVTTVLPMLLVLLPILVL